MFLRVGRVNFDLKGVKTVFLGFGVFLQHDSQTPHTFICHFSVYLMYTRKHDGFGVFSMFSSNVTRGDAKIDHRG